MPFKIGLAEKRKKLLEEELKRIIPKIIELDVKKIILFGSLNSNVIHKASDIDIIVIKETDKRFFDRLEEIYQHIKPNFALDLFFYTPVEFEEMKKDNRFVKFALKNGRLIYEK